ncbi:MAG: L-histidine N(alpha)-methyltransferase [Pseudomonadota bacterium]|nr:L-histidine N(alpha)-methyltransferase [Pseudomonadota bacterium]
MPVAHAAPKYLPGAPASASASSPVAIPRFIHSGDGTTPNRATRSAAQELAEGLTASAARIAPKFFYNPLGSRLFEAITGLDEYYPTRTEAAIFADARLEVAQVLQDAGLNHPCLIDLGAGNCAKALELIPHLGARQYVPVDISVDFLRDAAAQVQQRFPVLDIVGLGMDFSAGLDLPEEVQAHERVFFYPGSSLGNFHPEEALAFLQQMADPAQGRARGLLLGIDLVKDTDMLEAAYDDALGVTAAFNKNVLRNANELLGADFDVCRWRHVALFNSAQSRIEMHLEAKYDQTVRWPGHARRFLAGERIHTESSYKYTPESMSDLLARAGFGQIRHWSDPKGWFAVFWAAA